MDEYLNGGGQVMGQYAIEVEKEHAQSFNIPSVTILQRAEIEENDTVGFIVESKTDLRRTQVIDVPGVLRVEPL